MSLLFPKVLHGLFCEPDAPDGTFPNSSGFISLIHLVKSPWKALGEGGKAKLGR